MSFGLCKTYAVVGLPLIFCFAACFEHYNHFSNKPASPTKRQAQLPGFGRGFGRGGEAPHDPQFHRGLTMEGRQVPSSNERLGLILSDLMR